MAAQQAACFSGRTFVQVATRGGSQGRRRNLCPSLVVRSSLEEEFKKQCLGLSNGTSSNQPERLKDLSASWQRGAADLASSSSSSSPPPSSNPSNAMPQPQQPPATNSDEAYGSSAAAAPSGLPPLGEGYHPLEFYPTSHIDLNWGTDAGQAAAEGRARCFVILFGVGRAETEGIYSLRAVAKDDGLPVDTIVAFENEDDALRYSTLLEATMDHEPTVWPIEWGELLEFCNSAGYRCRLEPSGSLLIPPDYNVGMTDWEKSLKLRKGEFSVLGAEPAPCGVEVAAGQGLFVDGPAWVFEAMPLVPQDEEEVRAQQLSAIIDTQLSSPAALAAMRASLERLLPQGE